MSKFIDISEHNNFSNYNKIVTSDIKGVIIKATEGVTYDDSMRYEHYCKLNGQVPLGFYHMLCVTSSPELQAEKFYDTIKDWNYEIVPVVDVEYNNLRGQAEEYTLRFLNRFMELSGIECIIYTGKCYAEECFSYEFRKNYNWWIASYGVSNVPNIEGCNIVAWQYTESCKDYDFIDGYVDCNILLQDKCFYMGTDSEQVGNTQITERLRIQVLQNELNIQGFRDYEGKSLVVDSIAGDRTLSACPLMKIGATGNITMWLQTFLLVNPDGIFGDQTYRRVIWYQKQNGLTQDGIVGKDTWRKVLGL